MVGTRSLNLVCDADECMRGYYAYAKSCTFHKVNNMLITRLIRALSVFIAFSFSFMAHADAPAESGFLDDYSKLEASSKLEGVFIYARPGYEDVVKNVTAIIIPQPELFIAPDSKYKGLKANEIKEIADLMRSAMFLAFEDGYQIADNSGPNTIVYRMALTNLHMHKRPRRLFQYLPPAYLATAAKRKLLDDMAKNIVLAEAVFEAEITDAISGEILGQLILPLGVAAQKSDLPEDVESWAELEIRMALAARRIRCRLDNAKIDPNQRVDCLVEITLEDVILVE